MRLAVCSHKPCWPSSASPSGYATDGGFAFQMDALSQLFESTTLLVPCQRTGRAPGEIPLTGRHLSIAPLTSPRGTGVGRKLAMVPWLARNAATLWTEVRLADAVHAPIPGDVGTIGMLLALALGKPLFVRHCGNWHVQRTAAERFWRWFMERFGGGRNVMLATGGDGAPPSARNPALRWIFSTTLTINELRACAVDREHPGDRCRLIIACRQETAKGTAVVIDAMPQVLERWPEATLDVVGDGSALRTFKERATALDLDSRVTFHGKVGHAAVIDLMKRADVFCYPTSSSEGFPKVVLEALACGLPVITTPVSVLPYLLRNGAGLVVEQATPAALAAAIDRCLESRDGYRAMSARAVETARQFSLERWTETIAASLTAAWGELRPSGA
jgi:hypothetical protein